MAPSDDAPVPSFEKMDEPSDSHVRKIREVLAEIPGDVSQTSCGCTFKRVSNFLYHGCLMSGDILIRFCAQHEWENSLPLLVARQLSRQRREVSPS